MQFNPSQTPATSSGAPRTTPNAISLSATPSTIVAASPPLPSPSSASVQPPASPAPTRVRGVIDYFQEDPRTVVQLPAEAIVNMPFVVTIVTFGSGCDNAGDAEVTITGNTADITVYDYHVFGVPCTEQLKRMPRTATLKFPTAGEATIRVNGQRFGPETTAAWPGTPTTLERRIRVRQP